METARKKQPTVQSFDLPAMITWWRGISKRGFDILASGLGLLFLSPVFCLLAFYIKRESPGPVFYRGPRAGKGGKAFGILKFRTMYECAASYQGPRVTGKGDSRITPLGKWLRETKLNELPQLWNVLVGEMSLVGPRPEDPEIARKWPEAARREILSVLPGMTSPASIIYRDEENMLQSASVMDDYLLFFLPDKLRLDQLYVRSHNLLSDLDVILWTLIVLLPRLHTQSIPTESLYNGLLYRFMNRYFNWLLVDSLVAFTAVGLAGILWRLGGPLNLGLDHAIWSAVGMALIFSLINFKMGLGRIAWQYARPMYSFDLALSSGLSALLVAVIDWLWPGAPLLPLGLLIVAGLLAFLGFVAVRYRERLLTGLASRWITARGKDGQLGERILIVGAGECALLANWLLRRSKLSTAFSVVGMVDDDPTKQGMTIDGHRVFGLTLRIPEIVQEQDVGLILFAIETIEPEEQRRILSLCHQTSARVILIPDLLGLFRERLNQPVQEVQV
jgi:lipopolysaccharide/colanic/teichoic acid biosynthesis glycosyltransferase